MQWNVIKMSPKWLILFFFSITLLNNLVRSQNIGDPYKILGVNRYATLPQIRKAYKQLAKEWHPDKNEDPQAESRFVTIKQAYELLSDSDRRLAYDIHGITNEDESLYKTRHDYSRYKRYSPDPFDEIFGFNGARFKYQDQDITLFHKLSITTRHFENNIVEKSVHTPALILFYSDWCFECVHAASVWRRLVEVMQPLGVTMATVHAGHESALARKVGVHSLPCLIMVLDRHTYVYKDSRLKIHNIIDFMRWRMPYKLVQSVSEGNVESFLSGYEDNKVRGLIFENRSIIRLRYLLTAFQYRERVLFGFVDMQQRENEAVRARYSVDRSVDTVVLLKEDLQHPAATVSTTEIPTETLHQLIQANLFLTLPRLSSQAVLDKVCPVEWAPGRRRLCCVLVSRRDAGAGARAALRRVAAHTHIPHTRLRYAYIYTDKQDHFISALASGSGDKSAGETSASDIHQVEHRIVVIWRRDSSRVQYEWLNQSWPDCGLEDCSDEALASDRTLAYRTELNQTQLALEQLIKRLLRPTEVLSYEASVMELVDESALGAWAAGARVALMWLERVAASLHTAHAHTALSVLATVALILAAGYLMAYLVRMEEESIQRKRAERKQRNSCVSGNNNEPSTAGATNNSMQSELRLHELRAEKYNGLVRLLKPGCRTIVILVDLQSRVQLLTKFHKIVWPYRKNKTLLFAHLLLERNLEWYRNILQLSLPEPHELQINARNCVGTVLALNGHRKYFSMFHAKHPESARGNKRMHRMTRSLTSPGRLDPEAGAFIGFDSEPDSSDNDTTTRSTSTSTSRQSVLLQENLLDGLDNWLDRLFEGSTHRYYINYWPDFTTK